MLVLAALIGAASERLPPGWSALCTPRGDETVVCGHREPPPSRYRAPLPLPRPFGERGTASVSAERNRLLGTDVGTIGTCSAWGAGGAFGCRHQQFKDSVHQAAGSRDPRGRVYDPPR